MVCLSLGAKWLNLYWTKFNTPWDRERDLECRTLHKMTNTVCPSLPKHLRAFYMECDWQKALLVTHTFLYTTYILVLCWVFQREGYRESLPPLASPSAVYTSSAAKKKTANKQHSQKCEIFTWQMNTFFKRLLNMLVTHLEHACTLKNEGSRSQSPIYLEQIKVDLLGVRVFFFMNRHEEILHIHHHP